MVPYRLKHLSQFEPSRQSLTNWTIIKVLVVLQLHQVAISQGQAKNYHFPRLFRKQFFNRSFVSLWPTVTWKPKEAEIGRVICSNYVCNSDNCMQFIKSKDCLFYLSKGLGGKFELPTTCNIWRSWKFWLTFKQSKSTTLDNITYQPRNTPSFI